jgi:hypothetical protein
MIILVNHGFDVASFEYAVNPLKLPNFTLNPHRVSTGATIYMESFALPVIQAMEGNYGVAWLGGLNDVLTAGHLAIARKLHVETVHIYPWASAIPLSDKNLWPRINRTKYTNDFLGDVHAQFLNYF